MRHISLPWGSVIVEADDPRRYELFLESTEDSLRRRCYLRLDFHPGEWTVTVKPQESVVCASCASEPGGRPGARPSPERRGRCDHAVVASTRCKLAIVPFGETRRRRGEIVELAAWGRRLDHD